LESPDKGKYWLVSARSAKWGLNQRKIFSTEDLALKYARDLEAQVIQNGMQSDIPKEKLQLAASYEKLVTKLSGYGRTPEEAVDYFLVHLGNEAAKQAKPFIRDLVDSWKKFKYADSTLSHRTVVEIPSYARFIKTKWGGLKPDALKRNDIDLVLKKLKIANNTRRKYLLYVRSDVLFLDEGGRPHHSEPNGRDQIQGRWFQRSLLHTRGDQETAPVRGREGAGLDWLLHPADLRGFAAQRRSPCPVEGLQFRHKRTLRSAGKNGGSSLSAATAGSSSPS